MKINVSTFELSYLIDSWIFNERNRKIVKRKMIDGITFQQIVFQDLIGPLAEAGTLFTFYPITDRNNNIQIVIINLIYLSIRSSIGKFCPN